MAHHEEQECCILSLCCGALVKRVKALAGLLRDAAPGPDKFGEMAAILWERNVVRKASVFVVPAFATVDEVEGFLRSYSGGPDKYVALATALLNQGYVVSIADILWPPVLNEIREGLECLGIPYDGEAAPIVQEAPPEPAVEPETVKAEPIEELVVPPKPRTRPKATPKKVIRPKKK